MGSHRQHYFKVVLQSHNLAPPQSSSLSRQETTFESYLIACCINSSQELKAKIIHSIAHRALGWYQPQAGFGLPCISTKCCRRDLVLEKAAHLPSIPADSCHISLAIPRVVGPSYHVVETESGDARYGG